ncbi:MAG: SulP family inorganic anion transporter [Sandaracinus sp.]|nr:SulP family inorganic anion transporter [Sandaracinus sp.]
MTKVSYWSESAVVTARAWRSALGSRVAANVGAGISTALVALPLNVALALVCELPASVGLWTGAVAGVIGALFGGARLQVTGPEVALAPMTLVLVREHGVEGMLWCTFLAGLMQIGLGFLRVGKWIGLVPKPVVLGFMAAVGVMVLDSQLPRLLGLPDTFAAVRQIRDLSFVDAITPGAFVLGAIVIALLLVIPKIHPRIPAPLVALGVALTVALGFDVTAPRVPDVDGIVTRLGLANLGVAEIGSLLPSAFGLALLASLDSLLSAVSIDARIGARHRSDQELVAQGLANIACGCLGGMPVAGAIVRSAAAADAGGTNRLAPMAQSIALGVLLVAFAHHLHAIPVAALAAVLLVVGARLLQPRVLLALYRRSRGDAAVVAVTLVAVLAVDFVPGVLCGIVAALVRMAAVHAGVSVRHVPVEASGSVAAIRLEGPLHFANVADATAALDAMRGDVVLVDMTAVTAIDESAIEALLRGVSHVQGDGRRVQITGARPSVEAQLVAVGLADVLDHPDSSRPLHEALAELRDRVSRPKLVRVGGA